MGEPTFEDFVTSNVIDLTPRPPITSEELAEYLKYRPPVWLVSRELAEFLATMEEV